MIDRAVIVCGTAETSLRKQARDDKEEALKAYQRELLDNDDKDGLTRLLSGKVDVHFSNDVSEINEIIIAHSSSTKKASWHRARATKPLQGVLPS